MPEQKRVKQKGSSALIFGILSLAFSLTIPLPFGLIFGILGLVKARRKDEQESATTALICSIIGLIISGLALLLLLIIVIIFVFTVTA